MRFSEVLTNFRTRLTSPTPRPRSRSTGFWLSHMARSEGAVETRGCFGELGGRQLESAGGGADELGGNVASAAGEWV